MSLFSTGARALKAVRKIKAGGTAKVSYAMVSMLIISLQDAKAKLSPQKYKAVEDLFAQFQKCTILYEVDAVGYVKLCENVIRKFDEIAPYQLYSGNNELETSIYMDELHKRDKSHCNVASNPVPREVKKSIQNEDKLVDDLYSILIESYPLMAEFDSNINRKVTLIFYQIVKIAQTSGKEAALKQFDALADALAKKDPFYALCIVPMLCGVLEPTKVVSHEESNALALKYSHLYLELVGKMMESHSPKNSSRVP